MVLELLVPILVAVVIADGMIAIGVAALIDIIGITGTTGITGTIDTIIISTIITIIGIKNY
jgi:hypothetical protein